MVGGFMIMGYNQLELSSYGREHFANHFQYLNFLFGVVNH